MSDYVSKPETEVRELTCEICNKGKIKLEITSRWEGDALGTYEGRRYRKRLSCKVFRGIVLEIGVNYGPRDIHVICQKCKKKSWSFMELLRRLALVK